MRHLAVRVRQISFPSLNRFQSVVLGSLQTNHADVSSKGKGVTCEQCGSSGAELQLVCTSLNKIVIYWGPEEISEWNHVFPLKSPCAQKDEPILMQHRALQSVYCRESVTAGSPEHECT